MSRPMDFKEFAAVINHVKDFNSPFNRHGLVPCVKYIDPVMDMRTNAVFSIGFRGFGSEKVFHCQNECRYLPESLYDRCMNWLKGAGGC